MDDATFTMNSLHSLFKSIVFKSGTSAEVEIADPMFSELVEYIRKDYPLMFDEAHLETNPHPITNIETGWYDENAKPIRVNIKLKQEAPIIKSD